MYIAKQLKKITLVVGLAGLSTSLYAADTANGTATATVVAPITVTENFPMNFGDIAVGTVGGTVILATDGTRSVTGDVDAVSSTPGTAATFNVTGVAGAAYTIGYGAGTLTDGGVNSMAVNGFSDTSTGTLAGGSELISVGATLTVTGSQVPGSYSTANAGGTPYTVTVNYN
jgi:hypothetical protein